MNLDRIPARQGRLWVDGHLQRRDGQTIVYQLVMPEDADVEQGLISTASPIGRALLNKEEGDEVTVDDAERRRAPLRADEARDDPRRMRPAPAACDHSRCPGSPVFDAAAHGARADRRRHGRRVPRRRAARAARSGRQDRSRRRSRRRRARRAVRRGRRRRAAVGAERPLAQSGGRAAPTAGGGRCASPAWAVVAGCALLATPLVLLARWSRSPVSIGLLFWSVSLDGCRPPRFARRTARWLDALFAPTALPDDRFRGWSCSCLLVALWRAGGAARARGPARAGAPAHRARVMVWRLLGRRCRRRRCSIAPSPSCGT